MRVAVVTVGDELLAGEAVDTNAAWLCERLHGRGADVERVTTVPDRVADIARIVNEYRAEYDAVVVTGGLGPTHDDVTMEGIAAAVGRDLVEHEGARAWLADEAGYEVDDLASGTADLPAGARYLPNEVGVAPGAVVESIYALPGVPAEMEAMFERVADEFTGRERHVETVHAAEPESALLDRLAAFEERFDATVGSYPGESVRLRVRASDARTASEGAAWLRAHVEVAAGDGAREDDDERGGPAADRGA
ncbi:MAG: competence/damage-inducible protein A [Haloferacaceae archaeon]